MLTSVSSLSREIALFNDVTNAIATAWEENVSNSAHCSSEADKLFINWMLRMIVFASTFSDKKDMASVGEIAMHIFETLKRDAVYPFQVAMDATAINKVAADIGQGFFPVKKGMDSGAPIVFSRDLVNDVVKNAARSYFVRIGDIVTAENIKTIESFARAARIKSKVEEMYPYSANGMRSTLKGLESAAKKPKTIGFGGKL
jgi:hypothetical protein